MCVCVFMRNSGGKLQSWTERPDWMGMALCSFVNTATVIRTVLLWFNRQNDLLLSQGYDLVYKSGQRYFKCFSQIYPFFYVLFNRMKIHLSLL